ncbi:MAG TPA: metallophosphoesterase [Candidatus Eisenbacteria bacterium]|jgi:DNA repair exonuclease SbcCD nuclease subunit
MALARFLQVSDLHLGRPFGWLPTERRQQRRRDLLRVLERAVAEAIERDVHALLVPGDLFDQEGVDADLLASVVGGAFRVTGCPPVFIAPGNHDPYSASSQYWNARLLKARGLQWPDHVHVFESPEWRARTLPAPAGVRVWGRCSISGVATLERPLQPALIPTLPPSDGTHVEIAVFHGSREGRCPPGQKITAPFSDAEALEAPFAYLAAGHYHTVSSIGAAEGASAGVRLAYAGSAAALDVTEVGAHGGLEVRVEYGRRLPFVETEFVPLDRRRIFDLAVDVTRSTSAEAVDLRLQRTLDDAGVSEEDLVTMRLTGRLPKGVRYAAPGPELAARAFHVRVDLRGLRPDYDLEAYRATASDTTEEKFARSLLERIELESDPLQRSMIESALYYGLDAFRLREVVPAYEELAETESRSEP